MFVADTVAAFHAVATAPASAVLDEAFNAGTGAEVSIGHLAEDIARLLGVDAEIVSDRERLRPKDSEVMRLVADLTRLRERTGWQPRHSREDGLRRTIEWFLDPANLARYRPEQHSQ